MASKKMPAIKTLKRNCHDTWSKIVRLRDRHRCQMCGSVELLQAHHSVVTDNQGGSTRYDTRNGICFCYTCHIIKHHRGQSSLDWQTGFNQKVHSLIPIEIQDEITLQSKQYFSTSNKTIHSEVLEQLKQELSDLQEIRMRETADLSNHI